VDRAFSRGQGRDVHHLNPRLQRVRQAGVRGARGLCRGDPSGAECGTSGSGPSGSCERGEQVMP
jgi:hypothetical protein